MADNYLESRYEAVFGSGGTVTKKTIARKASLDTLLLRNRSFRGYEQSYVVHRRQLEAIVAVNTKIASSVNQQRLRFRLITKGEESDIVNRHIRMGRALPELHLPFPGTEPEAFIIVCATCGENPGLDIDLGISLQSMLLKAVDLGLGGLIIRNMDYDDIQNELSLPSRPLAVLAVGKPGEIIELVETEPGDSLNYYRKDGVHYVPKLPVSALLI